MPSFTLACSRCNGLRLLIAFWLVCAGACRGVEIGPADLHEFFAGLTSDDPKLRSLAAGRAIGKKDERLLDLLVRTLSDNDTNVRKQAATAIAQIPGDRATKAALENLAHPDPAVRAALYHRFLLIGELPAEYLGKLQTGLDDIDAAVRQHSASAVHRVAGDAASSIVSKMVEHQDTNVRKQAIAWLSGHPNSTAAKLLASRLDDFDNSCRTSAAVALRNSRPDGTADVLAEAAKHHDSAVRRQAVQYFTSAEDPRSLGILVAALSDWDKNVRNDAAGGLRKKDDAQAKAALKTFDELERQRPNVSLLFGKSPPISKLTQLLQHRDASVRSRAAQLIRVAKDEAGDKAAIAALKHEDPVVRKTVASRFLSRPDAKFVDAIKNALQDSDAGVRLKLVQTLEKTKGESAVRATLAALKHPDSAVRRVAVNRFISKPDPMAIPELVKALDDIDPNVRQHAARALQYAPGEPGDQAAIAGLKHPDPIVRAHVIYRFAARAKPETLESVVDSIADALGDNDTNVRQYAAQALSKTPGDKAGKLAMAALTHSDPSVRRQLAQRFQTFPNMKVSSKLIDLLNDPVKDVQLNAIRAIGYSGDRAAFAALRLFVDSTQNDLRTYAGNAIKMLARRLGTETGQIQRSLVQLDDHSRRWIQSRPRQPVDSPAAVIEMLGGDRIAGRVVGCGGGKHAEAIVLPPHLLIDTTGLSAVQIAGSRFSARDQTRVLSAWVRRVVWERRATTTLYQPSTAMLRNGRKIAYRSLRWDMNGVVLLTEDGPVPVEFENIAELHMPIADAWSAYAEQLTVSGCDASSDLLRLACFDGSRVTVPSSRFLAFAESGSADPLRWLHVFQPAWSLDLLSAPYDQIWLRNSMPATDVPLLPPTGQKLTGTFYKWRADRSVIGRSQMNASKMSRWGFGVHGDNVLQFNLPNSAVGFTTRVGLDSSVGRGGCARASVRLRNNGRTTTLATGPVMIGSEREHTIDTRKFSDLKSDAMLELVVDSMHKDRPAGADPLNIRDIVNWSEPIVHLSRDRLQSRIVEQSRQAVFPQIGWNLPTTEELAITLVNPWWRDSRDPFQTMALFKPAPTMLTRKVFTRHKYQQMSLHVWRTDSHTETTHIEVEVDGRSIGKFEVPRGQPSQSPPPIVVPLDNELERNYVVTIRHLDRDIPTEVCWGGLTLERPAE